MENLQTKLHIKPISDTLVRDTKYRMADGLREFLYRREIVEPIREGIEIDLVDFIDIVELKLNYRQEIVPLIIGEKHSLFTFCDGFEYDEDTYILFESGVVGTCVEYEDAIDYLKGEVVYYVYNDLMEDYFINNGWAFDEDNRLTEVEEQ